MKSVQKGSALRLLGASGAAALMFLSGIYVARAGSDSPAPSRSLWFAGSLQRDGKPSTQAQTLVFTFKKTGVSQCSSLGLSVTPAADGRFDVQVPLDGCPSGLFDGSPVTVDISADGAVVSKDLTVASVPYAVHADQLGTADCPSGYSRAVSATNLVLCQNGLDQLVRVGTGATAFWIDRFEASVWSDSAGKVQQFGAGTAYPASFPASGQVAPEKSLFALSEASVLPSIHLTWSQMNRACRASGKRLPTNDEWLEAANSTPSAGAGDCQTNGTGVRQTGLAKTCVSVWGAEDMVGNVGEVSAEWVMDSIGAPTSGTKWASGFAEGALFNIASTSWNGRQEPLVVAHGGLYSDDVNAGVYTTSLAGSVSELAHGFRCVIPR